MARLLSEAEITQQASSLPEWQVVNQELKRTFKFNDFIEAIAFVNQLVQPAESLGHHPDISISYNKVIISLTTHDAGGLTEKDFELAQALSALI